MKTYLVSLVAAASMLAGCNRTVETASQDFNALPPVVQKAIRAEAPNGEIAHISQKTENGMQVYEVEFREPGSNPKLVVSADGRVLNSDRAVKPAGKLEKVLTPTGAVGTKFSALPEAAQKTILAHAPPTEIADIERHERDGRVIYEVEFKDKGQNPSLKVAEDGTLVQELQK